jgi:hypothetical protein
MAEELNKVINPKIGKFRTDKEVAEELGAHLWLSGVSHGTPVRVRHSDPILGTRAYEVSFPDGSTNSYAAHMIAESLSSQVDANGKEFMLMKEIMDHRFCQWMTTKGWKLLIEWKDCMTDWLPLKDLKESYQVQVAEYAVANKIAEQPTVDANGREFMPMKEIMDHQLRVGG